MRLRLDIAPAAWSGCRATWSPYWVDEPPVDLEYHVHHIALPDPSDWRQLCIQIARMHSQPLNHLQHAQMDAC